MEVRSRQDAKSVCIKRRQHEDMSAGEVLEEDCFVCYVKAVALIGLRGRGRGGKRRRGGRSLVEAALSKIGVDWRYDVGVCTGPSNGYVYGGDEGRVLTFVRRERRAPGDSDIDIGIHRRIDGDIDTDINGGIEHGDIDTDFKDVDNVDLGGDNVNFGGLTGSPALSEVLRWAQESKRDGGVLSYEVTELEARRVTGVESGWECVLVANFGRHKPFPPAGPAETPWQPSAFNFYKADRSEFVLSYTPSFRHPRRKRSLALRGAAVASDAVGCGIVSTESPPQDAVLVNIRPVGPVSLLLTPGYAQSLNQRATAESLAVAMDFAEALMDDPGFRLGFNSGGSSASVNHLHFQCWYFDAGPAGLPIESAKTRHVATVPILPSSLARSTLEERSEQEHEQEGNDEKQEHNETRERGLLQEQEQAQEEQKEQENEQETEETAAAGGGERGLFAWGAAEEGGKDNDGDVGGVFSEDVVEVHALDGYPIRALVFHTLGKDLEAVSEAIEKCVNYLLEEDTPHTMVFSTGRAFLLPRQPLQEPPFAVVPGFPEVSGEVIVTSAEDFPRISADDIFFWWEDKISVSAEHFQQIIDGCLLP
eukprot:jgi/Undpi1/5013/HiC_scaffold_19.g08365.m1